MKKNKLKQLIKNQLELTEIPAYFESGDKRLYYDGFYVVYDSHGQIYNGPSFDKALQTLLK